MTDPRRATAELAGNRLPRWTRLLGWIVAVIAWAIASEGRPLLALLSVLAAVLIRCVYVVLTPWGRGRSVFWSSWFFAVAAACEVVWLIAS
jgi:hypothetical protein